MPMTLPFFLQHNDFNTFKKITMCLNLRVQAVRLANDPIILQKHQELTSAPGIIAQ